MHVHIYTRMFPVSPALQKFNWHYFAFTKNLHAYLFLRTKRQPKRFLLAWKRGEKQNQCSVSVWQGALWQAVHTPRSGESSPTKLLPWDLHSAHQHQAGIALRCVCEHLCFISIYSTHPLARWVLRHQKNLREVIFFEPGNTPKFFHVNYW